MQKLPSPPRYQGLSQLRVIELQHQASHYIEFNDPTYLIFGSSNKEYDTHTFRFGYTSLVLPMTVFEYDLRSRSQTILKQNEVPGGTIQANTIPSEFLRDHLMELKFQSLWFIAKILAVMAPIRSISMATAPTVQASIRAFRLIDSVC